MSDLLTAGSKEDEIARTAKSREVKAKAVLDGHGPCAIVNHIRKDTTPHVEALVLWQSACGGRGLSKMEYQHLIACTDCETLAHEITAALNDIAKTQTHRNLRIGPS
jgi:hypothetical protein